MEKKRFYSLSILITTAIITIGCSSNKTAKPTKPVIAVHKPAKVVPVQPTGITLSQLHSGGVTKLALKGKNVYKNGEQIEFTIDTKGAEGFLYIVYSDSKGEVGVLYPNPKSPESEMTGTYLFPRDFGTMAINATKDCNGCKKDKTVIYALLTKKRILDIHNINQAQLNSIVGISNNGSMKTKGIRMNLNAGTKTDNSNVNIGVLEFFVK
jgi:hypothetical protein